MILNNSQSNFLMLIKASLWGTKPGTVGQEEYEEMKEHALLALPADLLSSINLEPELYRNWKNDILHEILRNNNYLYEQAMLQIQVPYVILKGTTAAQYYPHPEYRKMGDIDIITGRDDYSIACDQLLKGGFVEETASHQEEFGRHRSFSKNGVVIEVHAFFALLNNPKYAEYLDNLIITHINSSHILPDLVNGLVLLEHIDQHLEEGLGLRQIIDWMMFVDKCLTDEKWLDFRKMAQHIGLEKLAIIVTRMSEIYLGLSQHKWCEEADEELCDMLMSYVLSCGNFGSKCNGDSNVSTRLFTYARTPMAFLRLLQERGLVNWKAAQKYRFLRPFAWIYQFGRYQRYSLVREDAHRKMKRELKEAKRRAALFDALGVKQISKGIAIYDNGKYVKTYKRP